MLLTSRPSPSVRMLLLFNGATGNRPPVTKVVDVHLHGHTYNPLFIFIRSRGRHPLTRQQRQKPHSPGSPFPWLGQLSQKILKAKQLRQENINRRRYYCVEACCEKPSSSRHEEGQLSRKQRIRVLTRTNALFILHP